MTYDPQHDSPAEEAELFRLLVENVQDYAVFVIDRDRRVRTWNTGAERLLGYSEAEILGQSADRFFTPEDRAAGAPEREVRQALATGRGDDDRWHVRKDGTRFWSSGVLTPLYDASGNVRGLTKLMRDRTDLKAKEDALYALKETYRTTLSSIGDCVIAADALGRVTFLNSAAETVTGWAAAEAAGRPIGEVFQIIREDSRQAVESPVARALRDGRIVGLANHTLLIRRDGSECPIDDSAAPIQAADGTVTGAVLVFRDVTERRQTEAAVRESEARLRAVVEQMPAGVILVEAETGRALLANRRVEEIWRQTFEHVAGVADWDRFTGFHADGRRLNADEWPLARAMAGQRISGEEIEIERGDGTRAVIRASAGPIRDADGRIIAGIVIFSDVTEWKRAEQAIRHSEARFRALYETNVVGVAFWSADGSVMQVNDALLDIFGFSRAEFEAGALDWRKQTPPEYGPADERALAEMAASGRYTPFEKEFFTADGRRVPALIGGALLPGHTDRGVSFVVDLTAQKAAEAKLRESEAQYRSLFDSIDEGFCIIEMLFDENGQPVDYLFLSVNPAFERQTGMADAAGKRMREFVPNHESHWFEIYGRVALTGEPVRFVNEAKALGRWFSLNAFRVGGPHSRRVGVLFTDITAARQAEAKLRESEHRSRSILESITDAFFALDRDWNFTYLNRRAEELLGRADLAGRNIWIEFPEAPGSDFERNYRQAMDDGVTVSFEAYYPSHERWYDVNAYPSPEGLSVYFRDANERRRAAEERERLLAEAEAERNRLKAVIDNVPVAVVLAEAPSGRMILGNRQIERVFRHPFRPSQDVSAYSEWVGYHLDGRRVEAHEWPLARALAGETVPGAEYLYERGDGTRGWIWVTAAPIIGTDGIVGAIVAVDDIEALKQAEEALREADRRKDEFLAMLAHELRNPLAPIRSGLDLLRLEGVDSEIVEVMSEQVGHVVRLVDDLLDVSRILRGKVELKRQPTDLVAVLRRAADTVRPRTEEHHQKLLITLPPDPIRVDADPIRLTQVVTNLLHNASKYTDDGGEVRLAAEREDDSAVIRVADSGIGIDPALLPKVFNLFTQADQALDRSQGGLGIGLTVVKSLVEMHDGTVTANSDGPGRGSEFTVRLPVTDATDETQPADPDVVTPAQFRILVVDDNAPGAKLLGRLLERLGGHQIEIAHDGETALTLAGRFRPDLILLDIGLPGLDGFETAKRLREQPDFQNVLLVALTGYGTAEDRRRSTESGFDDHLVKPPSAEMLKRVLGHPKLMRG